MTTTVLPVQRDLAGLFKAALERAAAAGALDLDPAAIGDPALERPRLPEHGDWATNVAMVLAKAAKAPPRKVAEAMVAHLELPDWVAGVEVAGPGHLDAGHPVGQFQVGHHRLGDLAGAGLGRLGQDHGDVGGPVAVLGQPRPLQRRVTDGRRVQVERPGGGGPLEGGLEQAQPGRAGRGGRRYGPTPGCGPKWSGWAMIPATRCRS